MQSLQAYLGDLPSGDIELISEVISSEYCPTALVHELALRDEHPVVYIQHPNGSDVPFVTNLFSSVKRIADIVGVTVDILQCSSWAESLEQSVIPPVVVHNGTVQEVIIRGDEVDVHDLPIAVHHEQDADPYITSGILIVRDPVTNVRNMSFSRIQVRSANRLGISLHSRGTAWQCFTDAEAAGNDLQVAIVVGAHPAYYLGASAKVSPDIDEFSITGALLKEPARLVKCTTSDLEVPADAEVVFEGRILANIREDEGPFGEYTGYSSSNSTNNVLQIDAMTRKTHPVYLDISAGTTEHRRLGSSFKKSHVLARLREVFPGVQQLNYPLSGVYYNAFVSIRKTAEGQARHALMLLFGLDPYVKNAIVVDDDIDVYNESDVLWALATRFQADEDTIIVSNMFCNKLDPSSSGGTGAKIGFDATRSTDWKGERLSLPRESREWARKFVDYLREKSSSCSSNAVNRGT